MMNMDETETNIEPSSSTDSAEEIKSSRLLLLAEAMTMLNRNRIPDTIENYLHLTQHAMTPDVYKGFLACMLETKHAFKSNNATLTAEKLWMAKSFLPLDRADLRNALDKFFPIQHALLKMRRMNVASHGIINHNKRLYRKNNQRLQQESSMAQPTQKRTRIEGNDLLAYNNEALPVIPADQYYIPELDFLTSQPRAPPLLSLNNAHLPSKESPMGFSDTTPVDNDCTRQVIPKSTSTDDDDDDEDDSFANASEYEEENELDDMEGYPLLISSPSTSSSSLPTTNTLKTSEELNPASALPDSMPMLSTLALLKYDANNWEEHFLSSFKKGNRWKTRQRAVSDIKLLSMVQKRGCSIKRKSKSGKTIVMKCAANIHYHEECPFQVKLHFSKAEEKWYICRELMSHHTCPDESTYDFNKICAMLTMRSLPE